MWRKGRISEMVAFPLAKLAVVAVKQAGKPLARMVENLANSSSAFRCSWWWWWYIWWLPLAQGKKQKQPSGLDWDDDLDEDDAFCYGRAVHLSEARFLAKSCLAQTSAKETDLKPQENSLSATGSVLPSLWSENQISSTQPWRWQGARFPLCNILWWKLLLKERFLEVTKVTKLSEEKAVTQASEIISEVKLF